MSVEPYTCDLDPEVATTLKIYLFKNVQNTEAIRNNILSGAWNCSIIKASLILDPLQVAVAANRASLACKHNSMVTRNIYAELLFNLSLSKNISQSLSKFGIAKDQDVLACFLVSAEGDASANIVPQIEGEQCPISELGDYTQEQDVRQVYKLTDYKDRDSLLDVVIGRMVTKSFVSY